METNIFVVFLFACFGPYYAFCRSDSSEEYRDEDKFRSNYGIEIQWIDQGVIASSYKSFSEPAGYENTKSGSTFLCRAYLSKTWVPGKLIGRSCYIVKNGVEQRFKEFQVPSIPANRKTRWVTLNENVEERQIPRNVVVGGNFWDTTAYICRGFLGRILGTVVIVPGSYHPIENTCYLGHNGAQVAWQGDTEVLVLEPKANVPSTPIPEIKETTEILI